MFKTKKILKTKNNFKTFLILKTKILQDQKQPKLKLRHQKKAFRPVLKIPSLRHHVIINLTVFALSHLFNGNLLGFANDSFNSLLEFPYQSIHTTTAYARNVTYVICIPLPSN